MRLVCVDGGSRGCVRRRRTPQLVPPPAVGFYADGEALATHIRHVRVASYVSDPKSTGTNLIEAI